MPEKKPAEEYKRKGTSSEKEKGREGHGQMTTEEAGHLGGQKVKRLIQEGKEAEERKSGG